MSELLAINSPIALPKAPEPDPRKGCPSASGMQRIVACPGSWAAEQACPPAEAGEAAAVGTMLHAHMEHGTMPDDPEQADAVAWCREKEAALVAAHIGDDAVCLREQRLWDGYQSYSGQADVVYTAGSYGLILDYKFGRGEVPPAQGNIQLAALACLTFEAMRDLQTIYAGILQPYVTRNVEIVKYDRDRDYMRMRTYFYKVLATMKQENAPLRPGEHCRYCRASAHCTAMRLTVEKSTLLNLEGWENYLPSAKRQAYDIAQIAKNWAESVERRVKADLKDGFEVLGLEMGKGRSAFTVTDAGACWQRLKAELPELSAEEFVSCCSVSMTKLDALVHPQLKKRSEKQTTRASKEWLRSALEDAACGEVKTTAGTIQKQKQS